MAIYLNGQLVAGGSMASELTSAQEVGIVAEATTVEQANTVLNATNLINPNNNLVSYISNISDFAQLNTNCCYIHKISVPGVPAAFEIQLLIYDPFKTEWQSIVLYQHQEVSE